MCQGNGRKKNFFLKFFFLQRKLKLTICFFPGLDFFLAARTDAMNTIITAALRQKAAIRCADAAGLSIPIRRGIGPLSPIPAWDRARELSTAVDNFVRNFVRTISFKFNMLTGNRHA